MEPGYFLRLPVSSLLHFQRSIASFLLFLTLKWQQLINIFSFLKTLLIYFLQKEKRKKPPMLRPCSTYTDSTTSIFRIKNFISEFGHLFTSHLSNVWPSGVHAESQDSQEYLYEP